MAAAETDIRAAWNRFLRASFDPRIITAVPPMAQAAAHRFAPSFYGNTSLPQKLHWNEAWTRIGYTAKKSLGAAGSRQKEEAVP
jgi:hypothetical protein